MIVGDWKTLQVLAVRSQSHSLDIKGGPFTVLNLRAFIAVSIIISFLPIPHTQPFYKNIYLRMAVLN